MLQSVFGLEQGFARKDSINGAAETPHGQRAPASSGRQPASRESLVAFFAAFPRLDFQIEALTAEGDRVAAEVTSRGELPEGQTYGNRYHNLFILKDSKIAFFREYPTGIAPN